MNYDGELKLKYLTQVLYIVVFGFVTVTFVLGQVKSTADAVVLSDDITFEIKSENKAIFRRHLKVQINRFGGQEYGYNYIDESKYVNVKNVSCFLWNENERLIKEYKKEDFRQTDYFADYILYDDAKYYWVKPSRNTFPYIVEYKIEQIFKSLLFWPSWRPQWEIEVKRASYRLIIDKNLKFNVFKQKIDVKPEGVERGKLWDITWVMNDIKPFIKERYMPPINEIRMRLAFAPSQFSLEGIKGRLVSWDDYGDWIGRIFSADMSLPAEAVNEVNRVNETVIDPYKKIDMLYTFLQHYTRYVAVELGLNGFRPRSVKSTWKNRYGDCKELSTLMIAMLKKAGIDAYPAFVRTNDLGPVNLSFPSAQFNHVIVGVPMKADTVWLECTAKKMAAGELPYGDEGCQVFMLDPRKPSFVKTPISGAEDNLKKAILRGKLTSSGDLDFSGKIELTGNQANFWRFRYSNLNSKEREESIAALFRVGRSRVVLESLTFINLDELFHEPFVIQFQGNFKRFANVTSNRLFLNPNILNRMAADEIPREKDRQYPVHYNYAFTESDSLIIELPNSMTIETSPSITMEETSFGYFHTNYKIDKHTLNYSRRFVLRNSEIPLSNYNEYIKMCQKVVQQDNAQFVLKR